MDKIFSNPQITALVMIFSVPIVSVIAYYWHETLKTRSNNEIKKSMLDRGMSAQEIEQVINAGSKPGKRHSRNVHHGRE